MQSEPRQSSIKVAIVGGGPGGLTLASILKATGIPLKVFELDASPSARSQGGMLDIHKGSGQLALAKAGLLDEFKKRMRVDATEFYLRYSDGRVHWHHTEAGKEDPDRPEIDRGDLRDLLLSGLEEHDVVWGKKLVRVSRDGGEDDGKFVLHFEDGTRTSDFDVVVGADGTWSKVRSLRSDSSPSYVGMNVLTATISKIDTKFPKLAEFVGNGSCMLVDGKLGIMAQKSGDGSVKTYSFIPVPERWREESGIDWKNQRKALEKYAERFHPDWAEEAKQLMIDCDDGDLSIRPLYRFPPGHNMEKKCSRATLLGDAAHVITPFAGEGVNLAMHDAHDLGVALEKVAFEGAQIDEVLEAFERQMLERASIYSAFCLSNQEAWYSGKSATEVVNQITAMFGWTK